MADKSDPTKDPEFQKVVRHFLTTPHKAHKPLGKRKSPAKGKRRVKRTSTDNGRDR
jgi:hypothetical protein